MGSRESYLQVINKTSWDIVDTKGYKIDSYDFVGDSRPTKNLNKLHIGKHGGSVKVREELTKTATNCPFTMDLIFSDGSKDIFSIHQRSGITIVIEVEDTREQERDRLGIKIDKEGLKLMNSGQLKQALEKFQEGLLLANQKQTLSLLKEHKAKVISKLEEIEARERLEDNLIRAQLKLKD